MRVLITGGAGMLAYDLHTVLLNQGCEVISCSRADLDSTDPTSVKSALSLHHPDIVINCAAYTAVDQAQSVGSQECYRINTLGTAVLAKSCFDSGIDYITLSTDYVFGGDCPSGYHPTDEPKPLSVYGMSKRLGEQSAFLVYPNTIVVRTSWLYGGTSDHKHFVSTMLRLAQSTDHLTVVNDQHGLPTYTVDLSQYLYHICHHIQRYRGKIVHATNTGDRITRYDFAGAIFAQAGINIDLQPCTSDQYPRPAPRPQRGVLISDDTTYQMPGWEDALSTYLQSARQ